MVSTYEEKETADVTVRTIQNDNACRAVTYFVRRIVELYAVSTIVSDISYRIIAPYLFERTSIADKTPDDLADGQVLLRFLAAGVCGSDLPGFRGAKILRSRPFELSAPGFMNPQ